MRKLRVLHILNYIGIAGTEYGVAKLINGLNANFIESYICSLNGFAPKINEDKYFKVFVSENRIFDLKRKKGLDFSLILKIVYIIRKYKIDIVHTHNWATFVYGILGARLSFRIVIHGEHGKEFNDIYAIKRKKIVAQKLLSKLCFRVLTVSNVLAAEVVRGWRINTSKVRVIYNGIDSKNFSPVNTHKAKRREFHFEDTDFIIGLVGRLELVKDISNVLYSMAKICKYSSNFKLVVVGDGSLKKDLENLSKVLGIDNNVIFLGERKDVSELMQMFDVFILSSLYEGMSNTILEAMASSIPVVATDVGGNAELVDDGITGYLVKPSLPDELASAIMKVFYDPIKAKDMGKKGREKVLLNFNIEKMVNSYTSIYLEAYIKFLAINDNLLNNQLKQIFSKVSGIVCSCFKLLISNILLFSGVLKVIGLYSQNKIIFLTYHRVLPQKIKNEYYRPQMVVALESFEQQIKILKKRFSIITLKEAIYILKNGYTIPKRAVVITFDDGYMDNYDYAYPILKKYTMPATFFLTTDPIDNNSLLWWDELGDFLQNRFNSTSVPSLSWFFKRIYPLKLKIILFKIFNSSTIAQKNALIDEVITFLNMMSKNIRLAILDDLLNMKNYHIQKKSCYIMLTWDVIRELDNNIIDFGAHTKSHPFVCELPINEMADEIYGSKYILENRLSKSIEVFCYPKGLTNSEVEKKTKECGFKAALSTNIGFNDHRSNLYSLRRITVTDNMNSFNNKFSKSLFLAEILGVFDILLGRFNKSYGA